MAQGSKVRLKGVFRMGSGGARWAAIALMLAASQADAQSIEELRDLSLGELANVNISSVSKSNEALADAPAAIFVITRDDILRSGATTLPEILRLAPNLYVAQNSASGYTITARGLSGNPGLVNFTNKLLVLIDGRSVYSPFYSGVFWDMQDVLPDDVERIEVISGPGATLWGANAFNGVINIITRRSGETQGLLASADAGARERSGTLRYGGRLGGSMTARVYLRGLRHDETVTAAVAPAHDAWWRVQGGFRLDWTPNDRDAVTVQGDLLNGRIDALQGADTLARNRNLLARWTRTARNGGALEVQAYFDRTVRDLLQYGRFGVDAYDLYLQQNIALGAKHDLVWGGGLRAYRFDTMGSDQIYFVPPKRTSLLANIFAQYGWTFARDTELTLGIKLEKDPYVGTSVLPNARLAWKPIHPLLLWASVARAVRSPTPFDRDVVETLNQKPLLIGGTNFRNEKLTAFEAGTRLQATSAAALSLSVYYNLYDDLKALEITPITTLPFYWANAIKGHSYGLEARGDIALARWWKLRAGLNLLHERFDFKPGATRFIGANQVGNDPRRQATLGSAFNIGRRVSIDADFRYVGPLPNPAVPSYCELGGRISWRLTDRLQVSVSGTNLLHDWHQELPPDVANQVPRSILAGLKWRM
jgi:iron complex outermembrane receptor protein